MSHKFLKLSFFILFLFAPITGWFQWPVCIWVYWSFLLLDIVSYWTLLLKLSVQLYFLALWFLFGISKYFLFLCITWKSCGAGCVAQFFLSWQRSWKWEFIAGWLCTELRKGAVTNACMLIQIACTFKTLLCSLSPHQHSKCWALSAHKDRQIRGQSLRQQPEKLSGWYRCIPCPLSSQMKAS